MSDLPRADDGDDVLELVDVPTVAPPDPFANLPKPRRGFEIHGPDDDPPPAPAPDAGRSPADDGDAPRATGDR